FVAACAALALVRDSLVWMVAGLALVVIVYALVRDAARPLLAAGLVLLGVSGFALVTEAASHRNVTNIENVLFVRVFPYPDPVAWFADHGMPNREQVDGYAAATVAERGQAKVVAIDPNDPAVQPLVRWMHDDAAATYIEWLALHPGYVLTEPLREPERTFNNA